MALRVAERLGPDQTVVTLAVDSGMKYLSTDLYSDIVSTRWLGRSRTQGGTK